MFQKQPRTLHENKSRDDLIKELDEIKAQLSAKEQMCRDLAQQLSQKSLHGEYHPISESNTHKYAKWFLRIFENHPDALVISRIKDGLIYRVNPAFLDLFGYSEQDVVGKSSLDLGLIKKADRDEIISKLKIQESVEEREVDLRTRSGEVRRGSLSIIQIETDHEPHIMTIIRDITKHNKAEQELQKAVDRYEGQVRLFEGVASTTPDFVYVFDLNGRFLYANRRLLEVWGMKLPDVIGKTCHELGYEKWHHDMHMLEISQVIETKRPVKGEVPFEAPLTGVFGIYEYIFTPVFNPDGEVELIAGTTRDVTERKKAEESVQKNKNRLELLATVAERLLRSEDPQAIIEDLCKMVMAHLDCQFFFNYLVEVPDQNLHLNAYAGISPEAAAAIRQLDFGVAICGCVALRGNRIIAEDIQNSDDSRTQLVKSYGVQAYCCHPLMVQGKLIGTLSFGTRTRAEFACDEISLMKSVCDQVAVAMQRLQTEKQLQHLNRSLMDQVAERTALAEGRAKQLQKLTVELIEAEEKEREKISMLLHDDFQQLLASAKMQLQAARKTLPPDTFLSNVEHLLTESISKSRSLSHELSPPVLHHSDIVSSLNWLTQKMEAQFGLHTEFRSDEVDRLENPPLKVFVFRAVQELLFNIVKHSGAQKATIDLSYFDSILVISINDQGKGFDTNILNSAKPASGLGLVSLRERISYMGGTFNIESAPGKGCRITLKLPINVTVEKLQVSRTEILSDNLFNNSHMEGGKIRVLLADDHKVLRQGLVNLISSQPDIQVVGEASNGRQSIELARQLNPHLILMDISMPEMDGIEATRIIKAEMPHIHVIGLSMHEDKQITEAMRKSGAEAFISKAASISELLKAIYQVGNNKTTIRGTTVSNK
jgi:PAS domain S-box-containing protein